MALKLNIGISRKVGMPDFGSVGASCSLELEWDASLLERDLDGFHARIRSAYEAASQAVQDELTRLQALPVESNRALLPPSCAGLSQEGSDYPTTSNGQQAPARTDSTLSRRPVTANQLRAILAIARRRRADLRDVLRDEFAVEKPEELSLRQASRLIDRLKAVPKD
jgi:hypothetical protein